MRFKLITIEHLLFLLFVFILPLQSRFIIGQWFPFGVVFNEWTSAFIWISDIFFIGAVILWLLRCVKEKNAFYFDRFDWFLIAFLLCALISISRAIIMEVAIFRFIKLIEFAVLYFYIKSNDFSVSTRVLYAFVFSASVQSIIGILQSLYQTSLGLPLVGESPLGVDLKGVAVFYVAGTKFLRAYGTMPHPNLLAFMLGFALLAIVVILIKRGESTVSKYFYILYAIMFWAFLLTFSRTIVLAFFMAALVLLVYIFYKHKSYEVHVIKILKNIVLLSVGLAICFSFLYFNHIKARIFINFEDEAIAQRLAYNKIAQKNTLASPLFGIGIGQFVPSLIIKFKDKVSVDIIQPAHNLYLLIASEVGIIGSLFFAIFLLSILAICYRYLMENGNPVFLVIFGVLIVIAMFDHFMWTLQQGGLLFWYLLAILAKNKKLFVRANF